MDSQQVVVDGVAGEVTLTPGLTARPEVAVNGVPISVHDGSYELPGPDGTTVRASLSLLAYVHPYPGLRVGGRTYRSARVSKRMWVVIALPLLLLFGGVMPLLIGLVGTWMNVQVMRSNSENSLKVGAMGAVTVVCGFIVALIHAIGARMMGTY